ncbi:L-histidine N(alpha)-methyltransferase [Tundrisphaera sp. TA3]|uniref:L-histidine N(alpha)-methyltransferase n=1 Tax=Tundrisphaera sp. TA3 TaxID=3435775 RepID=UPI003EBBDB68
MLSARTSGDESPAVFAQAVRDGLGADPKTLPCRYFYDAEGSRLFEEICDLPEYYPTRTEDQILRDHADAMVDGWMRDPVMIELGSGSSTKTRRLIAASLRAYGGLHYVPIDVSASILEDSARSLVADFPALEVTGFVANYRDALDTVFDRFSGPKLVVFLGSSLGNYESDEAVDLLSLIARGMDPSDRLLLGTDLDKDPAILEAAYDDARGVTARFNLNLLERINRELGGRFDPGQFEHRAIYRADRGRVEMHLVSRKDQVIPIEEAGISVRLAAGESIHTESSHKYSEGLLQDLARRAGFEEEAAWTDRRGWFRVQKWRPAHQGY